MIEKHRGNRTQENAYKSQTLGSFAILMSNASFALDMNHIVIIDNVAVDLELTMSLRKMDVLIRQVSN